MIEATFIAISLFIGVFSWNVQLCTPDAPAHRRERSERPVEPVLGSPTCDRDSDCNQSMTLDAGKTFTSFLGRIRFSHIQLW